MKNLILLSLFTLNSSLFTSLFATPFAPDPATEVVVYSSEKSASPLHVSTISTNPTDTVTARSFPSSYTGHRSVCTIPGTTTNDVFCAWIGGDAFEPGDPFGVSSGRDYPVVELTQHSPVTPRIDLWTGDSDRTPVAHDWTNALATGDRANIRIVLHEIDSIPAAEAGVGPHPSVCKEYIRKNRSFICESDFLNDDEFDIAWDFLYEDVVSYWGAHMKGCEVTNLVFAAVVGNANGQLSAFTEAIGVPIVRRYEFERRIPTPSRAVSSTSSTSFFFRIENESSWASEFGTTYTAIKIKVMDGSSEIWNSGIKRIPACVNGEYRYVLNRGFAGKSWRVALYNSKFKTDTIMSVNEDGIATGDPFSPAQTIISE